MSQRNRKSMRLETSLTGIESLEGRQLLSQFGRFGGGRRSFAGGRGVRAAQFARMNPAATARTAATQTTAAVATTTQTASAATTDTAAPAVPNVADAALFDMGSYSQDFRGGPGFGEGGQRFGGAPDGGGFGGPSGGGLFGAGDLGGGSLGMPGGPGGMGGGFRGGRGGGPGMMTGGGFDGAGGRMGPANFAPSEAVTTARQTLEADLKAAFPTAPTAPSAESLKALRDDTKAAWKGTLADAQNKLAADRQNILISTGLTAEQAARYDAAQQTLESDQLAVRQGKLTGTEAQAKLKADQDELLLARGATADQVAKINASKEALKAAIEADKNAAATQV